MLNRFVVCWGGGDKTPTEDSVVFDSDTVQQRTFFVKCSNYLHFLDAEPELVEYINNINTGDLQYLCLSTNNNKIVSFMRDYNRFYMVLGFRINTTEDEIPIDDYMLQYFVEVPPYKFYDKNINYFTKGSTNESILERGKELYKRLQKLNLVEGQEFF